MYILEEFVSDSKPIDFKTPPLPGAIMLKSTAYNLNHP
jgi:hypothetical protein